MDDDNLQGKLKLLLQKILEPGYVMNNYYSDGLINKLSETNSEPEIVFLKTIPCVVDLIIDAMNHSSHAHISVKVFLTRILAIGCKQELQFTRFLCKQSDIIKDDFKLITCPDTNASLKVAYMEMALGLVSHNTGITWLLDTGLWKEILSLVNGKTTVFVVRQAYKFASEFLWKLNDLRETEQIKDVITYITKPLMDPDFFQMLSFTSDQEEEKCKVLEPMTHMLLAIVCKDGRITQSTILLNVMIKDLRLIQHIFMACDRIHKAEIALLLFKLVFCLSLAKVFLTKEMKSGVEYSMDDFRELGVNYYNTIQFFVQRRSAVCVLDFCADCTIIWKKIFAGKDLESMMNKDDNKKVNLKNQMLFMCLVPLFIFVKEGKDISASSTDRIHDYLVKLLNASLEITCKAAYSLRDLIEELDRVPLILRGVKKLTCLKDHLNDEQANLVFQALFYVLREYDPIDDYGEVKQHNHFEDSQDTNIVMTYVMDIVLSLVKNHNINWQESLEVICLYSVVFNILKRQNLSCKFIVTCLNVIAVTIKKFQPPNLSLLLDSTPGSTMHELGKLIYMKMNNLQWEIRDSALELLLVCTEIAFIKFPPFQKQIMENNLINLAATLAFNDFEPYVQVSALKCIGAASKINNIWDQLTTQYPDVQEQILSILRNNQEGIVRKEACNVLCDLFQNLKLTASFRKTIYDHMVASALSDFHWEVQLSALKFWKIVLCSLLTDQGMLDGVFPPVTFSKQSRKIVTLNEAEIQRRLLKILDELSSVGCLTVLVKLLYDDTEPEIMESALSISNELLDILYRYKVPDHLKHTPGEPANVEELLGNVKQEHAEWIASEEMEDIEKTQASDNVIDGIVNADDINLLANIYERHMSLNSEEHELPMKPKIKLLRFASPYLFVNFLKGSDFKKVIEQKRQWSDGIRSISSLLDDILGIYEVQEEFNSLDCY